MRTYYLFSGLGADHRAFQGMEFPGETRHISWVPPLPNESIAGYAERIAAQITSPSPILVGLSFGGMMALEVGKHVQAEQVILISSAKSKAEIPRYYRWLGGLSLQRLIPASQITKANRWLYWLFGAETPEEKSLLADILADTDPTFFRWAVNSIATWNNTAVPANTIHIHGIADRILPYRFVKADYVIPGGSHFMAVNRAKEISDIIAGLGQTAGR
ncbi:alpha/beta hydrolase [Parapedobacter defluvii]|uniref:alpha/beta hydrolase n=1 Tax=Parapedobacter defluvii TaxID=2045106 RepID=UPI00333EC75E